VTTAAEIEQAAQTGGWLEHYLHLKAQGLHWKKAAFVAWYIAPKKKRKPANQAGLAELLNYKTADTFRKWQHQDWFKELGIERLREAIFIENLVDVDQQTIKAALCEKGRAGVQARKLFYDLFDRYQPKNGAEGDLEADWWRAVEDETT
jgi:hypothetical protein